MIPKYFWDGDAEFSWVNIGEGVLQKKKRIKKKRKPKKKKTKNWFKGLGSSSSRRPLLR